MIEGEKLYYVQMGKWIKQERENQNIKQCELAEHVGLHSSHLSHFERGVTKLSGYRIAQLIGALGFDFMRKPRARR